MTTVTHWLPSPFVVDPPAVFNLADLFESVADQRRASLAVVAGADRLSYWALDQLAARWATVLADLGVGAGHRVALLLGNSLPHVAALLGAFKLRAVPLNVNQHYTVQELRHLLADADPTLIICEDQAAAAVTEALEPSGASNPGRRPRLCPLPALAEALAQATAQPRRRDRHGGDTYLLYTGGTTGLPRGVEWRQEDLFFAALGGDSRPGRTITVPADAVAQLHHNPTLVLVASPLMHGTAQWVTLGSLLSGGTVVLLVEDNFDPVVLLDLAERERVAQLVVVGDAFAVPLAKALDAQPERWKLDSLVIIASGGAALAPATAQRLLAHLPGAVVVDGYGTSETGGQARRIHLPGLHPAAGFAGGSDTGIVGFDGQLIAQGDPTPGHIGRSGRLPIGYRNDPVRSAQTFPVIDHRRWALTGDLGRWCADGSIELIGRGERWVNSGGEKVAALEVETVVCSHPAVGEAMVVGVPDPRFGEVVGVLVRLVPGASLSVEQLARFCGSCLARFKLPRHVKVVRELPRTPTGKPDYRGGAAQLQRQANE